MPVIDFDIFFHYNASVEPAEFIYEPRYEKIVFLHMRKQRRRSASR